MAQSNPEAKIKLRLNEWPHKHGVYNGNEERFPGNDLTGWKVGETREVTPACANYLTQTFGKSFLPATNQKIPAAAKTAAEWVKGAAGDLIGAINAGKLDADLMAIARAERARKSSRESVLSAIRKRMTASLGDDE